MLKRPRSNFGLCAQPNWFPTLNIQLELVLSGTGGTIHCGSRFAHSGSGRLTGFVPKAPLFSHAIAKVGGNPDSLPLWSPAILLAAAKWSGFFLPAFQRHRVITTRYDVRRQNRAIDAPSRTGRMKGIPFNRALRRLKVFPGLFVLRSRSPPNQREIRVGR